MLPELEKMEGVSSKLLMGRSSVIGWKPEAGRRPILLLGPILSSLQYHISAVLFRPFLWLNK